MLLFLNLNLLFSSVKVAKLFLMIDIVLLRCSLIWSNDIKKEQNFFALLLLILPQLLRITANNALVIGLPGKRDPGTTGGKSDKIEEDCAPVPGSFWSSGPFSCPRIGDIFWRQWMAAIVSVNMRLC